ncbi:succinate dehydrogenase flavoprotein subunit [Neisseria lactamica]|uniref:Succinate dehydrogenase flavoprotein subunit n=1 Tax=Neisseria lactamica TaxID=486 RepID=A0A378WDN6_NEILA|nr:succinate dehydrogenase flavoprotein subunit [Neisseria lactamica]
MGNKIQGIDYETALANLRTSSLELRGDLPEKNELLSRFHPDYQANARVKLPIGPNAGDYCHPDLAKLLISRPLIDDYDLSGAEHLKPTYWSSGGGGAGAAAALSATDEAGARVIMANKLRIGDSNTVMAEGGIQAAVGAEDSLQQHFDDTVKGGHNVGKKRIGGANGYRRAVRHPLADRFGYDLRPYQWRGQQRYVEQTRGRYDRAAYFELPRLYRPRNDARAARGGRTR